VSAYVAHLFGCHWPVTAKLSGFEKANWSNLPSHLFERRLNGDFRKQLKEKWRTPYFNLASRMI